MSSDKFVSLKSVFCPHTIVTGKWIHLSAPNIELALGGARAFGKHVGKRPDWAIARPTRVFHARLAGSIPAVVHGARYEVSLSPKADVMHFSAS